jgi:hypothetical protein
MRVDVAMAVALLFWVITPQTAFSSIFALQSSPRTSTGARRQNRRRTRHEPSPRVASIAVEEPSQPSCCDMFATSLSLSSRAGYPARCPACQSSRGDAACGLLGSKHCEKLDLRRHAGRYVLERDTESSLRPLASLQCATRPPGLTGT